MKEKVRLFLISNLVAASLLLAACGGDSPADDAAVPGEADTTQLEATPQIEEPVVGAEATPAVGEVEEPVVEATTQVVEEPVAEATTQVGEVEEPVAEATTQMGEVEEPVAEATTQMDETAMAAKASALIGHTVRDPQGEDIGEIEDLVIGLDSNQVKYAVLSFGGFLDIGDKLFAIPVNAFHFDHEQNVFVLNVTEDQLENAPGFDQDNWPDTATQDWDLPFRDFWPSDMMDADDMTEGESAQVEGTAQPAEEAAEAQPSQDMPDDDPFVGESAVRASEILDFNIHNSQGEEIGELEDIIIELDTGNVQYAVVSFEDEIDNTDELFGLQLNELNIDAENDLFTFDPDQSLLQNAPSFNPDEWDNQFNLELGQVSQ
jgi:sporulation protein YlmC with PRC-barrel domain